MCKTDTRFNGSLFGNRLYKW